MPVSINGTNGLVFPDGSTQGTAAPGRNRLINGAMMIDQRNNGASVTYPGSTSVGSELYVIDRWLGNSTGSTRFSMQRSTVAPAGFTNSILITTTTAGTPGANDFCYFAQSIEGFNVADLGFGTANASSVTVSFWVSSSLTGNFGASLANAAANRRYPFSFTINAANTFEKKSVTIPGDTAGTWLTDNGIGLKLNFDLGSGTNNKGTANAWAASTAVSPTGSVNLVATNGATLYLTGVQLEKGAAASDFDFRSYTTELQLCQRYYLKSRAFTNYAPVGVGRAWSSTNGNAPFPLPVTMRANPTVTFSDLTHFDVVTLGNPTALTNDGAQENSVKVGWTKACTSGAFYQFEYGNSGTAAWLAFSSEL